MSERKIINWQRGIIDFFCVALIMFAVLMFYLFGKPYERGFFCNDESLNRPYKSSTITSLTLYSVGSIPHICTIIAGEYYHWQESGGKSSFLLFRTTVPYFIAMAYNKIGLFVYGMGMTMITTDIAKYSVGRLRPHFVDLCKPNIDCALPQYQHVYIENFTCTATDESPKLLKNLRLSFPSGHSSFSAFVMVWIVLYLQLRLTWKGSKLLKHFIQLVCLMMAWFTALSRVSNYKHHWSDVLAGTSLGTLIALITVYGVGDLFKKPEFSSVDQDENRSVGYEMERRRVERNTTMTNGREVP